MTRRMIARALCYLLALPLAMVVALWLLLLWLPVDMGVPQ